MVAKLIGFFGSWLPSANELGVEKFATAVAVGVDSVEEL